jgi:2-haloacid dehalogenase
MPSRTSHTRLLIFDVFGTVVDWRGSIAREAAQLAQSRGVALDPEAFADRWRAGYRPAMDRVRKGTLPWMNIDALHRLILDEMLPEFGLSGLSESERDRLNRAWHRLLPWPDSVAGLTRLKSKFIIAPLSNGNMALLTNLAKSAGLPWDCILSAELFHHYKPDPETYLGAAALMSVTPAETMLVAAHEDDLLAARGCGLLTAFVRRPLEFGPNPGFDLPRNRTFEYVADNFEDLAGQLGA